jgi:hypothetical protein
VMATLQTQSLIGFVRGTAQYLDDGGSFNTETEHRWLVQRATGTLTRLWAALAPTAPAPSENR